MILFDILKKAFGCREEEYIDQIDKLEDSLVEKDAIISQLKKSSNIEEPESLGVISFNQAYTLLSPHSNGSVYLSDENFNLTSIDKAKLFTASTKVFARNWEKETHDCDNFSYALMGYWSEGLKSFAFGIAWSSGHAFNIMIDDKKQIYVIEPQTNNYMTLAEAKKKSTPDGLSYYPWRLVLI